MTFNYIVTSADWGRIAPLLVLVGMVLVVMLVDLLLPHDGGQRSKHTGPANFVVLPVLAFLGVLGALAATIVLFLSGDHQTAFGGMISSDDGALYADLIILSACGLGILFSPAYLKRLNLVHQGEYYALTLLATIGMMLLASATNFLIVFVGLEMLSLALYILCSFVAQRKSSQEAGMKYFLLSSFASAFLLYGMALTYGATGSTTFSVIASFLRAHASSTSWMLLAAMGLMAVGFAFKVSAVPFQAWTPDVYQGAPGPVTAFMSVGTKAAAFLAFARVFDIALAPLHNTWQPIVWAIAILTIVGGNIMAVVQSNVKRMLAYSGIAHAGYLLIGIVVGGTVGIAAILFYLLSYTFLNIGAFGAVSMLERADNSGLDAADLRGLWYRRPVLAGFLALFLLALAGFPPMAGFAAKFYLFYAALAGGHPELLIIGVLASILGMYYYLRIIATMFMERETAAPAVATSLPGVLPTPRRTPVISAGAARRTSSSSSTGGIVTAVAVKPRTISVPKTPARTELPVEVSESSELAWASWLGIAAATIGTFAMGTILPFWLISLAQQAATMMLK